MDGPSARRVVTAVLFLRVRGFADLATARVHLVAGTAAAVALIGPAAPAFGPAGRLAGALVLLGGAAAVLGLGRTTTASPVVRRFVDVVEAVLTAVTVPLALAAAGDLRAGARAVSAAAVVAALALLAPPPPVPTVPSVRCAPPPRWPSTRVGPGRAAAPARGARWPPDAGSAWW